MKNIFITLVLIMHISLVHSQTKYYDNATDIVLDDCTYVCELDSKLVTLYNKQYTYGPHCTQVYVTSGQPVEDSDDPGEDWFYDGLKMYKKCDAIWQNAVASYVTQEEANRTTIELYLNPQTGRIADVVFTFTTFAAVASIPPKVYRQIEKQLKEQLVFNIKPEGKKVNYIYLMYN